MGKLKELFLRSQAKPMDIDDMIIEQMDNEFARHCELSQEWNSGERSPVTRSLLEWEHLGQPVRTRNDG
jgi:hypothetical protein